MPLVFFNDELPIRIITDTIPTKEKIIIKPHSHTCAEFIFIFSGNGTYHVDGRVYNIKKFDLIFTRPGKHHYIIMNEGEDYVRTNIVCATDIFPDSLLEELPKEIDVLNFEDNETVKSLFGKMSFYAENLVEEAKTALFKALLVEIFANFVIAAKVPDSVQTASTNPLIEKALKYIKENLYEISSVDEICREIYITKSHLHHLFMENLRITPKRYIKEKRLIRARKRILEGEKPTTVFRECGFGDYASFYRNYKAYYGYPPSLESDRKIISAGRGQNTESDEHLTYF